MRNIVKVFPKIFLSQDLMKINRAIAYLSFTIKEIFEYANAKGPDDICLTLIRNAEKELEKSRKAYDEVNSILDENMVE